MTEQEGVAAVKKKWVGKQVKIIGNHPWSGEIGKVTDFQKAGISGKYGLIVDLPEVMTSAFVFDVKLLKLI